ncbi:probable anion transporter 5, chloroplastic isoform X4 [Magnolia sinica]|uniref:probable anion transporter 5, chloroplastic isoform X4 n=1 Tax=Magnolia sinica TaxID=86752 RepID=UPI0026591BB0|nr:probable anion transporter 5, chloroplastic isoform X4 [Magnolia sinica]
MACKEFWRKESSRDWSLDLVFGHDTCSFCSRIHAWTCFFKDSGWNRRRCFPFSCNRPYCQARILGNSMQFSKHVHFTTYLKWLLPKVSLCIEWLIPLQERSRAVAFVFGGLSIGSVLGLILAPPLIQNFGWESVFYIFGFLGVLWCLGFQLVKEGQSPIVGEYISGRSHGITTGSFLTSISTREKWSTSLREVGASLKDVPWKAFFRSPAVWAMIYAHFCGSWGHYTCLSWLPTYFSEELDLNLTEAAWVSVLPPMASILVTSIAAPFADNLISSGVETTTVRKICQAIAFISPAACMILSSVDLGLPPWEVVAILTSGLGLSSFALSGLYCTHQDISPEYASILLGITNTIGAVPGIVGVALTGYLLDSTHSWSISLFAPSIFFYLTGTVVWLSFASSKPQSFSKGD